MIRALVSIGGAQLVVVGLNPQRITGRSEARVPGIASWGGMDYQATGLGEASTRLEAVTHPHLIARLSPASLGRTRARTTAGPLLPTEGGLDALGRLQEIHSAEEAVVYSRLVGGQFLGRILGLVRIRNLVVDETSLHPFDGIGRRVGVELDLVFVGGP